MTLKSLTADRARPLTSRFGCLPFGGGTSKEALTTTDVPPVKASPNLPGQGDAAYLYRAGLSAYRSPLLLARASSRVP